eukprot:m.433723 g.433723  ORF g.433723 m.433723 type:complete len:149 (+) comp17609_c0_seq1:1685-2131(+)
MTSSFTDASLAPSPSPLTHRDSNVMQEHDPSILTCNRVNRVSPCSQLCITSSFSVLGFAKLRGIHMSRDGPRLVKGDVPLYTPVISVVVVVHIKSELVHGYDAVTILIHLHEKTVHRREAFCHNEREVTSCHLKSVTEEAFNFGKFVD